MAVCCSQSRSSSSPSFNDGVCYALSQLGKASLKLKDQQVEAISAVYDGNDVFVFLLALARVSVFRYFLV